MAEKKKMSTAEILASLRKTGGGGKKPQEASGKDEPLTSASPSEAGKKPDEKSAVPPSEAKPAAAKKPAKPVVPKMGVPKDTASILAAARSSAKRGPISKTKAASEQKEKAVAPAAKERPAKGKRIAVPPIPKKPDYARPKPAAAQAKKDSPWQTRRGFLNTGFWFMGICTGLWTLLAARFMFPNKLTEPPTRFKVGPPSNFPSDTVETKFKAQFGVWVINTEYQGQQQIYALRTVCTHLGCTPNWLEAEQKFKCPCHGSGFYIDGINFEGPAPRPLERYAIRVADDGQLEIDKSKLFLEEMGKWKDPSSFVLI